MKRLLVLLTLVALTLSLTACSGTSGTTSGNASKETVQSSTTPAGSENTTPEPDPSPESSKQPVADDPTPTSDELPNGYLEETPEITDYLISGQLGEPGDSITTIETANFYYTIFIPTLDPDLSVAIDQADSFYLCLYEEGKLYDSPFCALVIYSKPITLSCMPSTGGKLDILITNGIIVSSHSVKQGDTVFNSTGISAISEANGRNVILSDDTLVEFSDSTFVLSQEKVDILVDTINLNF